MNKKEKVIIDTNIWYTFAKVSINSKVNESNESQILKKYELFVTTASIIEMISKYQDDFCSIKKNLEFIISNNIQIIQLPYFEIEQQTLNGLFDFNNFKIDVNKIIEKKIKGESNFIRGYVYMIASACFHLLEDKVYKDIADKNEIKRKHIKLTSDLFNGNFDYIFDIFHKKLNQAYKDDNAEQVIKKEFNDLIYLHIRIWLINFYILTDERTNKSELLSKIYNNNIINEASLKNLNKDNTWKKIEKNKDNIFNTFKKLPDNNKLSVFNNEIISGLSFDNHVSDIVIKFIIFKIKKIILDGAKFQKNDIIDMILLTAISTGNNYLLTLDINFLKALKEIEPLSYKLNCNFGFIN